MSDRLRDLNERIAAQCGMASITKWLAKPAAIAVIGCVGNRLARAPPTIACVVSINLVPYFGLPQMHCQFQQPKFSRGHLSVNF